ncbi:platelet-activating factor acetylhydrolase IB subunit beta [Folsomia candida]|uniref:Platelet-activating factor acetylhydrolase IB subunit beta n=1 Tax=Folsomia candida TaxID=158441 RepID=A0A226CZK9_FOLCA|nr:platelet-activating factor acetylhydrolase IB subunit beta [Folsomia candida]OXA38383.1 Platelet-activating factor acetylhydrolase IB subunit beta [Folsomia candida]
MKIFTIFATISFLSTVLAGTPWIPEPRDGSWLERHEGFVNNSLINGGEINLLFYGDSITDNWEVDDPYWGAKEIYDEYYAPLGSANYGVGSDRTEQVLWRIINGEVSNLRPKVCVLKIGTNNLDENTDVDIARGIASIVTELRSRLPETKVLLLGILPRENSVMTSRCENINGMISILDNGNTVRYLNMRGAYFDGNFFYEGLYVHDLIHLSKLGYAMWQEVMDPLFSDMFNSTN